MNASQKELINQVVIAMRESKPKKSEPFIGENAMYYEAQYLQWFCCVKEMSTIFKRHDPKFMENDFLERCGIQIL